MGARHPYPKVLIVGQCFDSNTGGGITLASLFRGWPQDRLAVAGNISFPQDPAVCTQYYQLGSLEHRLVWPLGYFQLHKRASGPMSPSLQETPPSDRESSQESHMRAYASHTTGEAALRRLTHSMVEFVGAEQLLRRLSPSPRLLDWIKSFEPDLIYTQLASLNVIRLVTRLIQSVQVPLVIHMMDDWPTTSYRKGILAPYLHWRMNAEFRFLLYRAAGLMGISQKMCKAYEARYGQRFVPFHNSIDTKTWLGSAKRNWCASVPFRLAYTGRVGRANVAALNDISAAVAALREGGRKVRLDIFTLCHDGKISAKLSRSDSVFVHPPISHRDVPETLVSADLLILPLDFDRDSIRFARYSMPTKTPEYMASGTPILVYAPADTAVCEYAQEERWGQIVCERGKDSLKRAITTLMDDAGLREQLGHRAQQMAVRNHDSGNVREAFRRALASSARSPHEPGTGGVPSRGALAQ